MSDIIWGTVTKILSNNSFEMNVSHQKDTNKDSYQDVEEINFVKSIFQVFLLMKNLEAFHKLRKI